jgi:exodeoxyribonuclease VII large subunit
LSKAAARLATTRHHLHRSVEQQLHSRGSDLTALDARLRSLSPLAVLDRGYALVLTADGSIIRSINQIDIGASLTTRVADGAFASRVESISQSGTQTRPSASTRSRRKKASTS